ncbi:hypothetical protein PsYK624_001070 [Phanerochaete sordida]|uniref:Uncharacterized protein n=1 Tax=Phanerochaete sordida TaxID=48140 RepID=A0A9P3FWX5_9APHY|nr:hypothetical protein PsYK624_001070 [Phanerochaete sordida]
MQLLTILCTAVLASVFAHAAPVAFDTPGASHLSQPESVALQARVPSPTRIGILRGKAHVTIKEPQANSV